MRNIIRRFASEEGTVIVITALAFTMMMGFMALAVDVGVVAMEKSRLSRTLDAAVLAGAQELPDTSRALPVAYEYAIRNEIDPDLLNISFPLGNKQITASAKKTINLYFAKFLGFNTADVTGKATAKISPVKNVTGILPVGIDESLLPLVVGQQYSIKVGSRDAETGWLGVLEYPGQSGADDYRYSARNGYNGVIRIGENQNKATGNVSGPTIQGIEERISASSETWDNYGPNSARIAIVPIYRVLGNLPTDKVRISGFASVFIEQVTGQGNENYLHVRYVNHTISGDTDDSLTDTFLNSVHLVE